jgi:hypothetical protein
MLTVLHLMLSDIMLNVVMFSVIMMIVVMLSVIVPTDLLQASSFNWAKKIFRNAIAYCGRVTAVNSFIN